MITTDNRDITPDPGVYEDVEMDEYLSWAAVSASDINNFRECPAVARDKWDTDEETKAQRRGRIIHKAVLEPDSFDQQFVVLGQCEATTGSGDRCSQNGKYVDSDGSAYCHVPSHGVNENDPDAPEPISETELELAQNVSDAVWSKTWNQKALGTGRRELSFVWKDSETELLCKARADHLNPEMPEGGGIVDLKTTRSAGRRDFTGDSFKFGYHLKAHHYVIGARKQGLHGKQFYCIAAEKQAPFLCAPYHLHESAISTAEEQYSRAMNRLAECIEDDHWPGLPDRCRDIGLPGYAKDAIRREKVRMDLIFSDGA